MLPTTRHNTEVEPNGNYVEFYRSRTMEITAMLTLEPL